jgi:DNA-binding response OmpR family regulator
MTHTALLSEADAYLSKPLRIDQLISTATDLIRNGRKTCSTRGDGG